MIILIIALITALAYTGQASMKLLEINNNSYYYDLMQGKAACGEIQTQNPMTLSYVRQLSKRFQSVIDGGFMLFGEFEVETNVEDQEDIWFFRVTDLENLPELLSVEKWDQLEKVPKEQRIILEESMADLKGCHLGDTITLASDWLGGQKEFTVVEIVKEDTLYGWDHGAIVDWDNLCQPEQLEEQYSGCFLGFWLDGDKEVIREKFLQLEQEQVNFSWYIYEDVMEQSDLIMSQRVATMFVVLFMLLIVTGIGWLNSAKGMLVARKEEYGVLRMLGASSKRVRRICWIQVWSYMLSGIVLGVLLGIVVVYLLWSRNLNGNVSIRIYWEYIVGIVGYLFVLSLLLKPTIDNKDL